MLVYLNQAVYDTICAQKLRSSGLSMGYSVLYNESYLSCSRIVAEDKQPMDCDAQLASACYSRPLFRWAILTRKVGHTGLVFGVRSWFISRSVALCMQD